MYKKGMQTLFFSWKGCFTAAQWSFIQNTNEQIVSPGCHPTEGHSPEMGTVLRLSCAPLLTTQLIGELHFSSNLSLGLQTPPNLPIIFWQLRIMLCFQYDKGRRSNHSSITDLTWTISWWPDMLNLNNVMQSNRADFQFLEWGGHALCMSTKSSSKKLSW